MSEENESQDASWSGLKKTIIGAITTAITAGGAWFATHLGGGEDPKEGPKTEQAAPAAAPIIKEKTIEKAAPSESKPESKPKAADEDPW